LIPSTDEKQRGSVGGKLKRVFDFLNHRVQPKRKNTMRKNTIGILAFTAALLATAAIADVNSDGGYTYYQAQCLYAPAVATPVKAAKVAAEGSGHAQVAAMADANGDMGYIHTMASVSVKAIKAPKAKPSMTVDAEIAAMADANSDGGYTYYQAGLLRASVR
jgi:hypothetical protein